MIYLLLIFLAPAAASLWTLFGGKKEGYVSLAGAAISTGASAALFLSVAGGFAASWSFAGFPGLPFRLEVSYLNGLLSLVVGLVATLIFLYAIGYMGEQKGKWRFWSSISLFLGAMQLLLFAGDWILFVIAWEVLGFCSYLLISTKHWNAETGRAANKVFLINRFADLGLYIGVFVIILGSGSSKIAEVPQASLSQVGALALLLAAAGKSAQVPFQSWLAAAMKGPTPVSALLHSATMVAAGIVLLIKAFPLFSPGMLVWIGAVGGITILMTGLTAIFSDDIKEMLAASSSSQLGFMVLAIGAGSPGAALAHLVAHAFMKSSLFLGAGSWPHGAGSTQFEPLTGAGKQIKVTFTGFGVAAVALAGIPPFVGYFSKDGVLAAGLQSSLPEWYFLAALGGALLTAMYMSRALGILWKGEAGEIQNSRGLRWMQGGLLAMLVFVIGGGFLLHNMMEMAGFTLPKAQAAQIGGLLAALAGLVAGWLMAGKTYHHSAVKFIRNNYPLAGGYHVLVNRPVMQLARRCRRIDESIHRVVLQAGRSALKLSEAAGVSDGLLHRGVFGFGKFGLRLGNWSRRSDERGIDRLIAFLVAKVQALGRYGRRIQSGLVHRELLWSVWGLVVFVALMFLILM